jgi:serine/threonine protein kinase/tetratricopeptide (TPR) repeat protein
VAFRKKTAQDEFQGTPRFLIIRLIGSGAFGEVYQAYDREKNSVVALKVLRQVSPDALYLFKREFRSLADITHPNLVTLYELMSDGDRWFFTMEFVQGLNFSEYFHSDNTNTPSTLVDLATTVSDESQRGPEVNTEIVANQTTVTDDSRSTQRDGDGPRMTGEGGDKERSVQVPEFPLDTFPDPDRLRLAFTQLAEGICALHKAGRLHRDIKPKNVLVTSEGRVVLLDFGLVTEIHPQEIEDRLTIAGTPAYMSPEQAAGLPVSEASDWYSVGAMVYEVFSGRPPFTGPSREVLRQKLMFMAPARAQVKSDAAGALGALCLDLLHGNPSARPTGHDVLVRLGRAQVAAEANAPASIQASRFVGREHHLAQLSEAFDATRRGRTVIAYVNGKSGMGKSALVGHFLDDLKRREPGVVELRGRCYEQESVPYKALDSVVDELSRYLKRLPLDEAKALMPHDVLALARLFPVLRQVDAVAEARRKVLEIADSQELRRRAFSALRELMSRLAIRRPLVLFIDDLQWGDRDSIALLGELLRPPDPPPLLLIASYRSEDLESSLTLQILEQLQVIVGPAVELRTLPVEELTPSEAHDLASMLLGQQASALENQADTIVRESGASPFFIHELARYSFAGVAPSSRRKDKRSVPSVSSRSASANLDEVIWSRVLQLPKQTRRFVEVVAVAGQPVLLEVVRKVTQFDMVDHQALAVLRSERLIRMVGIHDKERLTDITSEQPALNTAAGAVETYHDRVRESIVDHLSGRSLRVYHRRLGFALESAGHADPEKLAAHFREGGETRKAAEYAMAAAARAAEGLAFYRAAHLYRLTLQIGRFDKNDEQLLRIKLGDALANAGRGAEAAEVYLAAAQTGPAVEALNLRRRAAEQFLISGRIDDGLAELRTVLDEIKMRLPDTPRRILFSLLLRRLQVRLRGLKFVERDASQVSAEELLRIDICWSVAIGLTMVDVVRASDVSARHLLLALSAGEPYRVALALAMEVGHCAITGGKAQRRVETILKTATNLAERINRPHALALATLMASAAAYLMGQWKKSLDLADRAERLLRERCTGVAWELHTAQTFSLASLIWMGEWNERTRRLPTLLKEAEERGDRYSSVSLPLIAFSQLLDLAADDPEGARSNLRRSLEQWPHQKFDLQRYCGFYGQVDTALYCGEGARAWELVVETWPVIEGTLLLKVQAVFIFASNLRARSAIAAATDCSDKGKRTMLLKTAARIAGRIEKQKMAWGGALAQLLRAGIAGASGETERAVPLLKLAEEKLRAVDMSLFAAAARRRHGEIIGGDEGRRMLENSEAEMIAQGIKNPRALSDMLAPGMWTRRQ